MIVAANVAAYEAAGAAADAEENAAADAVVYMAADAEMDVATDKEADTEVYVATTTGIKKHHLRKTTTGTTAGCVDKICRSRTQAGHTSTATRATKRRQ